MSASAADFRRLATEADQATATRCIDLWRQVVSIAAENPEILRERGAYYILGYAYYQLLDVEAEASLHSEKALVAALEQNANDNYARLYLGHLAFDSSRYEAALQWFNSIPDEAFSGCGQPWRDLKRQELKICCLVHLGKTDLIATEFESYLTLVTHSDESAVLAAYELPMLLATLSRLGKSAV